MRRTRRAPLALAGVFALAILAAVAFRLSSDPPVAPDPAGPPREASLDAEPGASTPSVDVAGVVLPASELHGPRTVEDGFVRGFSDSEQGAALAAVHLLMRTTAAAGRTVFDGTLSTQALGTNVPVMRQLLLEQYEELRSTQDVADGAPIPIGDAVIRGYLVHTYEAGETATIDVVVSSATLDVEEQLVQFRVVLERVNDDWWLVAPPGGDWGQVATTLGSEPAGLQRFGDIS